MEVTEVCFTFCDVPAGLQRYPTEVFWDVFEIAHDSRVAASRDVVRHSLGRWERRGTAWWCLASCGWPLYPQLIWDWAKSCSQFVRAATISDPFIWPGIPAAICRSWSINWCLSRNFMVDVYFSWLFWGVWPSFVRRSVNHKKNRVSARTIDLRNFVHQKTQSSVRFIELT